MKGFEILKMTVTVEVYFRNCHTLQLPVFFVLTFCDLEMTATPMA